jgi:hypothetical protein
MSTKKDYVYKYKMRQGDLSPQHQELEKAFSYFGSIRKTAKVAGIPASGLVFHKYKAIENGEDLLPIIRSLKLAIASNGYIKPSVLSPKTLKLFDEWVKIDSGLPSNY